MSRPDDLAPERREALFDEWMRRNPGAIQVIELWAIDYDRRGLRVSTKLLVEKIRYDWPHKTHGVPFVDARGRQRTYSVNNNDTAVMARWLLRRHPGLRIETRESELDG